jgi:hypothetical protein
MFVHDGGSSFDIPQMAPVAPERLLLGQCSVNRSVHLTTNPGLEEPPNLGTRTDPAAHVLLPAVGA